MSSDGRYVAFASDAPNLDADASWRGEIYVHDFGTGTTTRVSGPVGGGRGAGTDVWQTVGDGPPAISANGALVAFASDADDLVPGDTNVVEDIFVHQVAYPTVPPTTSTSTTSTSTTTSTTTTSTTSTSTTSTSTTSTSTTSTSTTSSTTTSTTTTTVPPATTSTTSTSTTTTTVLPTGPALPTPYSAWTQAATTPLDGVGTWFAIANDPTAGPGQARASYLYGLHFGFASSTARGFVGLTTDAGGKTAVFGVVGPSGPPQVIGVPFPWTADRFYFVFVHEMGPGSWGALVYDLAANTWTPIAALSVPSAWGKLSPATLTAANWTGSPAATCAAYPRADVVVHAPTGFRNGAAVDSFHAVSGTTAGPCSADTGIGPGGWVRYRAGAT